LCAPGLPLSCDDDNPCTDDSCDAVEGCGHQDNEADCDDGNACTLEDGCVTGACVGGSTPNLCGAGGTCINEGDAFSCSCALGYEGGGVDTPCICVPIDGEWGSWSDWSSCSVPCGGGTQSRIRACTDPSPNVCGADCSGSSFESQPCNTQACCADIGGSCFTDGQCCSGHCWIDADGDSFGAPTGKICQTSAGPTNQLDCHDACATCYPGSDSWTDSPDGLDQDCDGFTDENDGVPNKECLGFGGNIKSYMVEQCKAYCGTLNNSYAGVTTNCPESPPDAQYGSAWMVTSWNTCESQLDGYGWHLPCSYIQSQAIECSCPPQYR
jgi:chondroitin sulfate proteoglycan 4/CUB/sushi domain-containing protein